MLLYRKILVKIFKSPVWLLGVMPGFQILNKKLINLGIFKVVAILGL